MKKRGSMSRHHSKRVFHGGAAKVHSRNTLQTMPMRGGIRL